MCGEIVDRGNVGDFWREVMGIILEARENEKIHRNEVRREQDNELGR